jgi:hypothetical protein
MWWASTSCPTEKTTRWPSSRRVVRELLALLAPTDRQVNWIEAFDQPWKRAFEGAMGAGWGFFSADGVQRVRFTGPVPGDRVAQTALLGLLVGGVLAILLAALKRRAWLEYLHAAPVAAVLVSMTVFQWHTSQTWDRTPLEQALSAVLALLSAAAAAAALAGGLAHRAAVRRRLRGAGAVGRSALPRRWRCGGSGRPRCEIEQAAHGFGAGRQAIDETMCLEMRQQLGLAADDVNRHVPAHSWSGDVGGGLVVAHHDEHRVARPRLRDPAAHPQTVVTHHLGVGRAHVEPRLFLLRHLGQLRGRERVVLQRQRGISKVGRHRVKRQVAADGGQEQHTRRAVCGDRLLLVARQSYLIGHAPATDLRALVVQVSRIKNEPKR